jgi:diacylglycerol kinase family enzyme
LIVNPVAGKGGGVARAEILRSGLARDHDVELAETSGRGDATYLARSRGADVERVIAIGGDGTLNEVLKGLMALGDSAESRPSLGFMPGGTANVATAAFGFGSDPARVARELPGIVGRLVDVGVADLGGEERPFLLWCGAGVDAVVIHELNSARTGRMGIAGLALNAPRVLTAVARYPAPSLQVTADGSVIPPASSVLLANVGESAFGGMFHPDASPFDGRLDVVTIQNISPLGVLKAGARMLLASLTSSAGAEHRTATRVTVTSEGDVPVQIDGEPVGYLPASVRLEKAAVRLLVGGSERAAP